MPESTVIERFIRMGREEGRQEGQAIGQRRSLIALLKRRFGLLPADLLRRIETVADTDALERALLQALDVKRPEDLAV